MYVVAVWITVCVWNKYLRIWNSRNMSKNRIKMVHIAVDLTKVSSLTELEDGNKFHYFLL